MKHKKITKYLTVIVVGLIGILIITRGITYAKYVSNAVLNYYLSSKGFYFDSEELKSTTKTNVDTSWNGENVSFTITNSANDTLATEYDIKYKVTCTVEEENTTKVCYLNGTTSSTIINQTLSTAAGCSNYKKDGKDTSSYDEDTCKKENYTWEAIPTTSNLTFNVVDTEGKDVDTATVLITATSTSPYEKTLSAKYILSKDKSEIGTLSLKYEEKTNYENIIITNSYNEDKCVKLTWNPSNLLIDLDDNSITTNEDDNNYVNEIIFKLEKKNSKNFIFYKTDKSKTYTKEDFTLVETTECE